MYDPACGSGRTLLSAAKVNRSRLFVGQDLDLRCVQMATINLALNGLRGRIIWGNTLEMETRLVYLTGFNGRGFISEVRPESRAEPPHDPAEPAAVPVPQPSEQPSLFEAA